jgi:catechol 2,3-dioxygenase-like lactoylglutathione lyase family enzyme
VSRIGRGIRLHSSAFALPPSLSELRRTGRATADKAAYALHQHQPRNIALTLGGITNLDYTILLCSKMDETRTFYRDVMKFPIETDQPNWCSFRIGAALLTLRPRGWSHFEDGKSVPGAASVQLAFRVPPPAVDACHAELLAKGVPVLRGPTDLPDWRHRTLFFRDPEDNVIEIYAEY